MSQISAIFGTDSDKEIMQSLYLIANVSDRFSYKAPFVVPLSVVVFVHGS